LEQKNYYIILSVEKDADRVQIKDAYRKLALRYHPDKNSDNPDASEKMKQINEAYAVLSHPEKRREYDSLEDKFGSSAYNHFRNNYTDEDIFKGSDINQVFEEVAKAFGGRGFDDIFTEFYGKDYKSFEFNKPGTYGRKFVFKGPFNRQKYSNRFSSNLFQKYILKIAGSIFKKMTGIELPDKGSDIYDIISITEKHSLTGGEYIYLHRKKSKKLSVQIPSGVSEGKQIRLKGMGEGGRDGITSGDLYLKIIIRKPIKSAFKNLLGIIRKKISQLK